MVGMHDLVRESNRDFSDKIVIAIFYFFIFFNVSINLILFNLSISGNKAIHFIAILF